MTPALLAQLGELAVPELIKLGQWLFTQLESRTSTTQAVADVAVAAIDTAADVAEKAKFGQ